MGRAESVRRLEELSVKYERNEEIALRYAQGLVFLSSEQEESQRKESLKRLDEIRKKYKRVDELFTEFFGVV